MKAAIGFRVGLAGAALLLSACATTTFESTWKAPDAAPVRLAGKKVAAIFMSRDPATRRRAEDAMAREITARGAEGVPSYTVLSDADVRDEAAARAKLDEQGFSGTVVMRVVGQNLQYRYEPCSLGRALTITTSGVATGAGAGGPRGSPAMFPWTASSASRRSSTP